MTPQLDPHDRQRAAQRLKQGLTRLRPEDIREALKHGEQRLQALGKRVPERLKALWADIQLLTRLLGDYTQGRYRDIPWRSIATAAAALIYFVTPMDIVPDFLTALGYGDDAFVIGLCLNAIGADLERYRQWLARDAQTDEVVTVQTDGATS